MNLVLEDFSGKPYIMSNVYSLASLSEEQTGIRKYNILRTKEGKFVNVHFVCREWKFQYTCQAGVVYGKLGKHLDDFFKESPTSWRFHDNICLRIPTKQEMEELLCQGVENFW